MITTEGLNVIKSVSKLLKIPSGDALFLVGIYLNDFENDIQGENLLSLIRKGYLKNGRLTALSADIISEAQKGDTKEEKIEKVLSKSQFPNMSPGSVDACKKLATYFIGREGISPAWFRAYLKYCSDDPVKVPFLWIFTHMFPTRGNENGVWNKHFGVEWGNIQLRKFSKGWMRKFNTIYKNKDISTFLLGTYLYIQSCHSEKDNAYYIKSIDNYMSDWEFWYDEAERKLAENKKVFRKEQGGKNHTTAI